jgi:ATP-dependent helicase HrpB
MKLPIEEIRSAFERAFSLGPVVLGAPTGSGKSTVVPQWCASGGRVLVVQPRRVAARGLAMRVAELDGSPLGGRVGYAVRDDRRASSKTQILFVTTGVALRMAASGDLRRDATLILDEMHERSLDLDLLLAHAHHIQLERLVVMSATLELERIAKHLGGTALRAQGRLFPVTVDHPANQPALPDNHQLEGRVLHALREAPTEGDVLVFLPGKGEIRSVASRLAGRDDLDVMQLHGGLTLQDQARVFHPGPRRRVILSTNVAETSLTVPRVRVVIDSGLVRRTRYRGGRGFLTLLPIAADSAEQRAGRAGRTAPGHCIRLWRAHTALRTHTPPEIHRESIVPLVLAAAATGTPAAQLPFLDPPKPYALEAAEQELTELGALDAQGHITDTGRRMFGMPMDAALARLLIAARGTSNAIDVVDLVSVIAGGRSLFLRPVDEEDEDDLRADRCDGAGAIRALRRGHPDTHGLDAHVLREARRTAKRLRSALGMSPHLEGPVDRPALLRLILAAWPRCAHVVRRRRKEVAFSNGGTELHLDRRSAIDTTKAEAILVLDTFAMAKGPQKGDVLVTAAMPVRLAWLGTAGLGRDRLHAVRLARGKAVAEVHRVYARAVVARRTEVPSGALARDAAVQLFLRGSLFSGGSKRAKERLDALALHRRLERLGPTPDLETWVCERIETLGVEHGDDLALLDEADLMPPALDPADQARLDRTYPRRLDVGDARYEVSYDPGRRIVTLNKVAGSRKALPPSRLVPAWPGWRVQVRDRNVVRTMRGG